MKKALWILGLALFSSVAAQAVLLVEYDLSASAEHPARHSPSYEDDLVAGSYLTASNSIMNYSSAWATDSVALRAETASSSMAEAIANDAYMSFTVTADSGYFMDLDSLDFGAYPGGSSERSFAVYSSVGGFAAGSELLSVSYSAASSGVNLYSIDLDSLSGYDDLDSVEFRFYVQAENEYASINISNIEVTGTIPEPATISLFALSGLGAFALRRLAI